MIWSFIFMITYMLVIVYLLASAFIMIFADSYRRATLQHGSPIHNSFEPLTLDAFLRWLLGWLPQRCLKRLIP